MKKTFTDKIGKKWNVTIATKLVNNRQDIVSVQIEATGSNPISRRALASISLEELFGNDLAVMSPASSRILQQRKTTSRQGRAHSDEDLQTVADIYTAARKARIPVQQAVADAQGVSQSTAAKRIMAAKARNLLPDNRSSR